MKRNLSLLVLALLGLVVTAYAADDPQMAADTGPAEAVAELQPEAAVDLDTADPVEGCNTEATDTMSTDLESLDFDPENKAWACMSGQTRWVPTSQCCCNGKKKELQQTCSGGRWVTVGSACIGLFCSANCAE